MPRAGEHHTATITRIPARKVLGKPLGRLALPLPSESFDIVLCQMGLQFVADRPAPLPEMNSARASFRGVVRSLERAYFFV